MLILATSLPSEHFMARFIVLGDRGTIADQAEAAGVRVDVVGASIGREVSSGERLWATLAAVPRYSRLVSDVDIVDAWLAPALTFAMLAQPFARVPVVLGGRRWLDDLYRTKPWFRRALLSAAARRAHAVVANSRVAAAQVVTTDRVPQDRVHTIPNAVERVSTSSTDREQVRQAWGWSEHELVVGCVANFKPEKRLDLVIEAARRLLLALPFVRYVLVGEGPLRAQLEASIRAHDLESVVRIHGPEPDARRLYPGFDVAVQASESEGLPNVILEAAAAGLPIVATDVGGTTEIVTSGREALLVPVGDGEAIATAIKLLATDPALRRRLGDAGRSRAEDFSVERLVTATAELYVRLAADAPAKRAR
jgi:glycosyltransferase involved in cell wall biosynthesis